MARQQASIKIAINLCLKYDETNKCCSQDNMLVMFTAIIFAISASNKE